MKSKEKYISPYIDVVNINFGNILSSSSDSESSIEDFEENIIVSFPLS